MQTQQYLLLRWCTLDEVHAPDIVDLTIYIMFLVCQKRCADTATKEEIHVDIMQNLDHLKAYI